MKSIQFIGTTPDDLENRIAKKVKNSLLPELSKEFQPKTPTEYLTRTEVAELLNINISTVHNWTRRGRLKSYGIGGRVYYKRKEVENAIVKIEH